MRIEQEIKHGNALQHYLRDGDHIYCVALHDDGNISVRRTRVKTDGKLRIGRVVIKANPSLAELINSRKSTWMFDTRY